MEFQVVASSLDDAATACVNTNDAIQAGVTQMQNYVAGLMGSYTGTAALALQALSDQWGNDAKSLNQVLSSIATNLRANSGNYVEFEAKNTANYTNLTSGLPPARF